MSAAPASPPPASSGPRRDRPRILVLCSGNICRSPMGEVLIRDRLAAKGLPGVVRSAGRYFDGREAEPHAIDAMARRGIDLRPFRSRTLDHTTAAGADLVLGMAREHVREAVVLAPEIGDRTFTLKEAVRRASDLGGPQPGESFPAFVARMAEGRNPAEHLGSSPMDDIDDPMGRSSDRFEATAIEVEEQVDRLVELLAPTLPVVGAPAAGR
jgi:protein-tyrosine phosphatase